MELLIQPYARQTRLDIIERTECLKLLVGVTVLTCSTTTERAAVISRWIQLAIDTKTALGNLYGFCAIMLGLCLPQIQRLTATWHLLRQKHTDEAFTFEAKLRPTLRAMNECTDPQAPNTTIPHILPIALLNERSQDDVLGTFFNYNFCVYTIIQYPENTEMRKHKKITFFSSLKKIKEFFTRVFFSVYLIYR